MDQKQGKRIFVFGSNTEGRHGAGAAKTAREQHKAIYGVPMGLQGDAYGIITKHLPGGERSVELVFIRAQISCFIYFASKRLDLHFYVTRIGCGHAGFTEAEIAPMFRDYQVVCNIELCPEFKQYLELHPQR